jgi:hypothetical protein
MRRKKLVAGLLTLLLAALLVWIGRGGKRDQRDSGPEPLSPSTTEEEPGRAAEAALRGTLEAAGKGDVTAYLSSFGGALRQRLEHEVQGRGRAAFAGALQQAARARKGHALFAPEPDGPDVYVIAVESVYPDRNERQAYRLDRSPDDQWLITAVDSARPSTPRNKYGELAEFQAPQDVPVQAEDAAESLQDR